MDIIANITPDSLRNVFDDLDKFETEIIDAIKKEVVATAYRIDAMAKNMTPVVTSRLRSSIHVETKKTTSYSYVDNNGNTWNGKLGISIQEGSAAVGTNVDYAEKINDREGNLTRPAEIEAPKFEQNIKNIISRK